MVKLLVCGGGNGAHVLAGTASVQPGVEVKVLTLFADEAERWTNKMKDNDFTLKVHEKNGEVSTVKAKPFVVTKDPAKAAEGADLIVLVVPAFAHQGYLEALKPHIKPGMAIAGVPGQAGFDFLVRGILGDTAKQLSIMSFETLPWACRIVEFGCKVEVLGIKESMNGAVDIGNPAPKEDPTAMMQRVLGKNPRLTTFGHLIGLTLNINIHPCIMYGQWHNWDGKPLKEKPPFYQGITKEAAQLLHDASQEVLDTAKCIMKQRPNIDLSNVTHIHDWYKRCYPDIKDKSSLYTCLRTNEAYNGLVHPMKENPDGTFVPDFTYRYLMEDIPCGLVVIRAVATVAGYPTPNLDKIISWAQGVMGKEYLVDGQLKGKDFAATRSPQSYGLNTLDAMLGL